jgi:fatty acid desaturase
LELSSEVLRQLLPPDAFEARPVKILWMFGHVAIAYLCFVAAVRYHAWWQVSALGLVAGHSLTCMGFMAHELSHGMIIKGRRLRTALECYFWGSVFVAPTMWKRTHNATHHLHYGTEKDSDRMFMEHERTGLKAWYVRWFYPNAELFPWNPLVLLYQVPYFLRNTIAAFVPRGRKLGFIPAMPRYRAGDSARVLGEILLIALIQASFFAASGFEWRVFLPMLMVAQLFTSVLVMSYVFTNHFLHPIQVSPHPLTGSSTVIVPTWIDWLHSHFSHHSEHHVFPTLRSEYYPMLSKILQERFPDQYHRLPIAEAWRQLWKNPPFLKPPSSVPSKEPNPIPR